MKTVSLSWNRLSILDQAKLEAYYIGESLKNTDVSDEIAAYIQASEDEEDVLSIYLNDAMTAMSGVFPHIQSVSISDGTVTFNTSNEYDDNQNESITQLLQSYFINMIISRWLNVVYPDKAANYMSLATAARDEITIRLARRNKPVVRPVSQGFAGETTE